MTKILTTSTGKRFAGRLVRWGGIATIKGNTIVLVEVPEATGASPQSGLPLFRQVQHVSVEDGSALLEIVDWEPEFYPLGKIEVAVARIWRLGSRSARPEA